MDEFEQHLSQFYNVILYILQFTMYKATFHSTGFYLWKCVGLYTQNHCEREKQPFCCKPQSVTKTARKIKEIKKKMHIVVSLKATFRKILEAETQPSSVSSEMAQVS